MQYLLPFLLALLWTVPASAVDSLVFLGRLNKMELKGLLRDHLSGEDWVNAWYSEHADVPTGPLIRRFHSVSDSVYYRSDTLTGGGGIFDSPIGYGDFNGDSRRDYVGRGYWILTGSPAGYVADSTGGQHIIPLFVGDFDGDGFDDVFGPGGGGDRIWWGDSADPLETSSFVRLPKVVTGNDTISGGRSIYCLDRYGSITVAAGTTTIQRQFNITQRYTSAWRVSESDLVVHQDTIHADSLLTEDRWISGLAGDILKRIGDTTIIQGSSGHLVVSATGCVQVVDSGASTPRGEIAGFGMNWPQRFLSYDYYVTDSTVTLLEFDSDSLKYRNTYEFNYGHVDSGTYMRYCSMFPDVNADGFLELAICYSDVNERNYYTNVYDVIGGIPMTFVVAPVDSPNWGQPALRDGKIIWSRAATGDCTIELVNLSGNVLRTVTTTGEAASEVGIEMPSALGNGVVVIRVTQRGLQQTFKTLRTETSR